MRFGRAALALLAVAAAPLPATAPGGRARGLSDWDRAFLAALYRIPHARAGRQQRGLLVREIVAALPAQ